MTSLRYLTCLFLLTVSLTDLSKAGCRDEFNKNAWKNDLTKNLPDYIPIQMDRQPKDVMKCSIKNTAAETTLEDCFEGTGVCEGESHNSTPVAFYHLMCLTDIAMNLTEKESKDIAASVCKVYEKVCEPFFESSSTSAPKMTTSSTAATTTSPATPTTTTAPPSSPKMTTSSTAATTTSPATPTTTTAPPSSPKMTTPTSSTGTTTASPATLTTATAPPSSPETTTSTPTTESVTSKTATAWQSASERSDKNTGAYATNETDIFKLQIVIMFLIFTNVFGPLAVYMYMRRQRNEESFNDMNRNMPDTVQMTIQPQTVVQTEDGGEGAVLLKTSQCSIIINPPETTQTENLCQNGLAH